jgi:penicillin-binding protein 1A
MAEGWFSKRREPKLGAPRKGRDDDLRVDPRDRAGPSPRRKKTERIEPEFFDDHHESERIRLDEEEAAAHRPRKRKAAPKPRKPKRRRRSLFGFLFYYGIVASVWGFVALGAIVAWHAVQLPPIDKLAVPKRPPNIAIMSDEGTLIANRGDTGGPAVNLADIPTYLPKAFVAIEDHRFYDHYGIDPIGITRAVIRNLTRRSGMEGGSTLTQQLAKNLFLTQERTISRKIQEAILAVWLEHRYSKDQILELYLNRVYFGSGAYGVEAAARKYFGHGARDVTLQEAATLAGLMKAPVKLAPNRNPTGAAERAAQVINAMAREGFITQDMARSALNTPAQAKQDRGAGSLNYAADYVMDILDDTIGAIDEDIVVSTTLSAHMQRAAELALTDELNSKGQRFGVTQGALVALDPNGQIKALVGGRNYAESQFNRAVAAKRQPGSSFKPFVYLTAIEKGLTPTSVRDDSPINVRGWAPENSTREYLGPVTLTRALSLSLNTVSVRLALEMGPKNVIATAHRLGIASELRPDASIALGTSEVTPLELVTGYAPFANGGIAIQPHIILRVKTAQGRMLYQRKGASFGRVIEPQHVAMMNMMMQETLTTGTAKRAELPNWQAAGKTGTSQDYRDAWFVGYTGLLVAGVWLGNDDNSPTRRASGANLPVDIWSRFMREALQGIPPVPLPAMPAREQPTAANGDGATRAPNATTDMLPPASIPQPQSPQQAPASKGLIERLLGG